MTLVLTISYMYLDTPLRIAVVWSQKWVGLNGLYKSKIASYGPVIMDSWCKVFTYKL